MTKRGFYPQLYEATHKLNTHTVDQDRPQCLHCRHYKPLAEEEGSDYGVCLSPVAKSFGKVVFEHFGCGKHEYAKGDR